MWNSWDVSVWRRALTTCALSFLVVMWLVRYTVRSSSMVNGRDGGTLEDFGNDVIMWYFWTLFWSNFPCKKKNKKNQKDKYSQGYQTHISTSFDLQISSSSHAWSWKEFQRDAVWAPLIVAMTFAFLCCLGAAIAFHAGFASYRPIVSSQSLRMAPRVWALPQVQAGSGRLETYLGRQIK